MIVLCALFIFVTCLCQSKHIVIDLTMDDEAIDLTSDTKKQPTTWKVAPPETVPDMLQWPSDSLGQTLLRGEGFGFVFDDTDML